MFNEGQRAVKPTNIDFCLFVVTTFGSAGGGGSVLAVASDHGEAAQRRPLENGAMAKFYVTYTLPQ